MFEQDALQAIQGRVVAPLLNCDTARRHISTATAGVTVSGACRGGGQVCGESGLP
jgi:hypothetical protein